MKKHSTAAQKQPRTVGIDLGDRSSRYCVLDGQGQVEREGSVNTTKKGLAQVFGPMRRCRIALEVGTHSPWVSRLLGGWGYEVVVANPRRIPLITHNSRKNDRMDARLLAKLARLDPELLSPIRHRSEAAQQHLLVIRARAALVEARTQLVNTVRGLVKSCGERLRRCDAAQMGVEELEGLAEPVRKALEPLLEQVERLTESIRNYDAEIEQICQRQYPETALLKQISGVGNLIALTYRLTLDDPGRFHRSRDVGPYLGLQPKQRQSGASEPQLRISKEGDVYLRKLLVQGAHYILGPFGPDTDLRRWGQRLAARGGKSAKKRARVAVARKLAVLLHHLWTTAEVYEPLRGTAVPAAAA